MKLEAEAATRLKAEGVAPEDQRLLRHLDMRYLGQWRALKIPCPHRLSERALQDVIDEFHATHQREHAFSRREHPVEVYGIRVTALGKTRKPKLRRLNRGPAAEVALKRHTDVYFSRSRRFEETAIYDRQALPGDVDLDGPCRLDQMDSTVVIPPKFRGHVDAYGNVIIRPR
jgi:N-methylhydantoinase A